MRDDERISQSFRRRWISVFLCTLLICFVYIPNSSTVFAQDNIAKVKTLYHQFDLDAQAHPQPTPPKVSKSWLDQVCKNIQDSGNIDPASLTGDPISTIPDWVTSYSVQEFAQFGYAVANAGDIDLNGCDDLMAGGAIAESGWTDQVSGVGDNLNSVDAVSDQVGWIAGSNGTILRTTNGGETWENVGGEINTLSFASIDGLDAQTAVVAGWWNPTQDAYNTVIYRTTNGGASWTKAFEQEGGFLDDITMFDQTHGVAYGDPVCCTWTLVETGDGGQTWTPMPGAPPQIDDDYSYLNGMYWVDNMNGWFATRYARTYHTTNGGTSWTVVEVSQLTKVYTIAFDQSGIGLASQATDGKVVRTTNNGDSWTEITSPTSSTFRHLTCHNSDFWMLAGTDIHKSTDNGDNWNLETSALSILKHVSFVTDGSQTYGWSVGDNGVILKYGSGLNPVIIKDDPFFPETCRLSQNYPNPFNPETTIQFTVTDRSLITLKIYNVHGQLIETLVQAVYGPGGYETTWNAEGYPSGIYLCRFENNKTVETTKLILQK